MIIDIHSHRQPPYPEGVVSLSDLNAPLLEGQAYSAGIHPWTSSGNIDESLFNQLESLAFNPSVVAIGECGVDLLKGGALYLQLGILKRHIELSEKTRKPLILHCVKGTDIILGLKRDFNPRMPWIIHGFRGKPGQCLQLTSKGIYLSFGEKFNPDTVKTVPGNLILAETDESSLSIREIIDSLSLAAGRDVMPEIKANTAAVLGRGNSVVSDSEHI